MSQAAVVNRLNGHGFQHAEAKRDPLPHRLEANRGRYDLRAALDELSDRPPGYKPHGLVGEVSQEIATRARKTPRGFYLPLDLVVRPEARALTSTTGAGAIPTIMEESQFIDVLRSKLVLTSMGARVTSFTSERGRVTLPRISSTTVVGEVAEGADLGAQSNLTSDAVTFTPHTIEAWTDITRTMISSSFAGFDQFVLSDAARALAVRMDWLGFNGAGTNQPVGLLKTPSIPTVAMGAAGGIPTRAAVLNVESTVGVALGDQGADVSLAWVTTPQARAKMRATDGASAGTGVWLWSDQNQILGFPALSTSNMPANGVKGAGTNLSSLAYGDWSALLINIFDDAIDVLVDPYKQSQAGIVRITSFLDIDVQLAHLASFCVISDLVTA